MKPPLKILYISQYYPPEANAPAVRVSALAKYWSKLGHEVTVVTGFPNHPTGVIPAEFRHKLFARERVENVSVLRSYLYTTPNKGFAKRIVSYLSFMMSAILSALFRTGKLDVIVATSPQFFVAVAGYVVSRIKRIPFVFEVRDVWPEEIVAVGAMKRGFVIRLLEKLEMFLYRKASLIVAVAQGTIELLSLRGVPREKILLLPNGVDLDRFGNVPDNHRIRDLYDLDGHFLVSYIGTHGMAHNLHTVLEAAEHLSKAENIRFLFVGDGADREALIRTKQERRLDNVTFAPQQPRECIPHYYAASDLCLVPLRRADLFTKNIPSKIYEIMASGKPILIGTEGESRRLVENAGAGLAFEPENGHDLAEKIRTLATDRQKARVLGENGRRFVKAFYPQNEIGDRYLAALSKIVE